MATAGGGAGLNALTISGTAPATANVDDALSFTPTITGGAQPYQLSSRDLPPGLSISGGTVSGTFAKPGDWEWVVRVTDARGSYQTLRLRTVVSPVALPAMAPSISAGAGAGTPIASTVSGLGANETLVSVQPMDDRGIGGVAPNDGRVVVGANGISLVAGLVPTVAGTKNYRVTTSFGRTFVVALTATGTPVPTGFYQLASNRFGIPTDVVANATGYLANTSNQQGNGTPSPSPYGTHQFRRWAFETFADATPSNPGVFLWAAAAQLVGGVYDPPAGSTGFLIEEVDIRSASSPSVIVATLTFGGSKSKQMTSGSQVFNDPITNMPAGRYFMDVCTQVDANGALPISSPMCAFDEYGKTSPFSNDVTFATGTAPSGAPASGTSGGLATLQQGVPSYGPSGFYVKTTTVIPNALIWGTSREDRTNILPDMLDGHGDFGAIKYSLSKSTTGGGRLPWLDCSRYSNNLYSGQASSPAATGVTGRGVFKYLYDAFYNAFGQTRSPFNLIYSEEGVNDLAAGNLAALQNRYTTIINGVRALWPNIPWVQQTILPYTSTGTASPYQVNTNDAQTTPGVTYAATAANGGYIDTLNSWIAGGGGGLFTLAVDVAAAVRSPTYYQSWKNETKSGTLQGYPGTLGSGVPANTVSTITLDFAPDPGSALAIDVGASTVETVNALVGTVTVNATNSAYYDVLLRNPGQQGGAAKKVVQAHANGVAVKESFSPEGLHQSHRASISFIAPVIDSAKSQVRSLAAAYTGS